MGIEISTFTTGPIETNSYLVHGNGEAALIVDPSSGCDEILAAVAQQGLNVMAIVLTHGHFDHIMGIAEIVNQFPQATVYIHALDEGLLQDPNLNGSVMLGQQFIYSGPVELLQEGDVVIGGIPFQVLHTPGHTPGGCSLLFDGTCIVGDTLFMGSVGRTDLPGGDGDQLLTSIREKLFLLPEATRVLAGHGPETTIAYEQQHNQALRWL